MFQGNYLSSVDSRNRVTIPFRLLKQGFGEQAMANLGPGKYIILSPVSLKDPAPGVSFVDSRGRITISSNLKDEAGLRSKVVVVGCGKDLEVWDNAAWEEEKVSLRCEYG